jgi:hypothetical protein
MLTANHRTERRLRAERLGDASHRVLEEAMRVNAELHRLSATRMRNRGEI